MEVLRLPPYPLTTTWTLPDANYPYIVYVEDLVDHSIEETTITSDANGVVIYELPLAKVQYDRTFLIRFYDSDHEHTIYEENLDVIRPYINPNTLGTTATEIADAKLNEMIARSIINTYINDDFHNHKLVVQAVGQGTDYFSMWHPANRVLKVYENNVLVYDATDTTLSITGVWDESYDPQVNLGLAFAENINPGYSVGDRVRVTSTRLGLDGIFKITELLNSGVYYGFRINTNVDWTDLTGSYGTAKRYWEQTFAITLDSTAVIRVEPDAANRAEQAYLTIPLSSGDLLQGSTRGAVFPRGYDYIFILDVGYKTIPPDVEQATRMLINDLQCGRLDYYKRYVTSYSTDQFRMQMDKRILDGTGNMMVDRILDKYVTTITKPGIL